jgi:hypothetical protein
VTQSVNTAVTLNNMQQTVSSSEDVIECWIPDTSFEDKAAAEALINDNTDAAGDNPALGAATQTACGRSTRGEKQQRAARLGQSR